MPTARRLRFSGRLALAVLLAISGTTASVVAAAPDVSAPPGQSVGNGGEAAVIVRDAYGVPSIFAKAMDGVWFGAGYAQAEDRLVQLELTRRAVEGTLSEIFGPSELSQDQDVRTFFYTPAELQTQFSALPMTMQRALSSFSHGINSFESAAFASPASEQTSVPYEFFVLGQLLGTSGPYRPAPWQPIDTVAVGNFLARQFGGGGGNELSNLSFRRYLDAEFTKQGDANAAADAGAVFNDSRWIDDPTAPTTVPDPLATHAARSLSSSAQTDRAMAQSVATLARVTNQALTRASASLQQDRRMILDTGISLHVLSHGGSNAFAVAPGRSKDGHALLWGAPQEGFGTPSIDGEEYLHGPGYDAGGMDITGEPFVLIGRNADIAWTTTSEELVDQRVFVETVNFATSPPSYLFNGTWIPMQAIQETIPVAGSSPEPFTVYRTVDGPVFFADPSGGSAFSLDFASFGQETGTLTGFAQLGSDHNLNQFRRSMSLIATLHNFLYADRSGNIAYFGDGLIPIEPPFSQVDPRLPALGDGSQRWLGFVPFDQLPQSVNPEQGFLDNWNTKPSQSSFYQQNSGDEYWGTIFRSQRISQLLAASTHIDIPYLETIEHDIGTIDNGDNTRPAAPYFIPFVVSAYNELVAAHDPIVESTTHPDLATAVQTLSSWDGSTTLGSPAMSIFMNFIEAFERNVFENGALAGEQYLGAVNFSDSSLGMGTFGGLGGFATYNLLYHALAGTTGIVPCGILCYRGDFFAGHQSQLLIESVNDAITILSGTGTQLGQNVPGFGTTDISTWGFVPAHDINWDSLDPLAVGVSSSCGTSPAQNRSTYMQAIDANHDMTGQNVLPPGQSGFISAAGVPDLHFCDQVGPFNSFTYKAMPTVRRR